MDVPWRSRHHKSSTEGYASPNDAEHDQKEISKNSNCHFNATLVRYFISFLESSGHPMKPRDSQEWYQEACDAQWCRGRLERKIKFQKISCLDTTAPTSPLSTTVWTTTTAGTRAARSTTTSISILFFHLQQALLGRPPGGLGSHSRRVAQRSEEEQGAERRPRPSALLGG